MHIALSFGMWGLSEVLHVEHLDILGWMVDVFNSSLLRIRLFHYCQLHVRRVLGRISKLTAVGATLATLFTDETTAEYCQAVAMC
jgi:hypothetical protein